MTATTTDPDFTLGVQLYPLSNGKYEFRLFIKSLNATAREAMRSNSIILRINPEGCPGYFVRLHLNAETNQPFITRLVSSRRLRVKAECGELVSDTILLEEPTPEPKMCCHDPCRIM